MHQVYQSTYFMPPLINWRDFLAFLVDAAFHFRVCLFLYFRVCLFLYFRVCLVSVCQPVSLLVIIIIIKKSHRSFHKQLLGFWSVLKLFIFQLKLVLKLILLIHTVVTGACKEVLIKKSCKTKAVTLNFRGMFGRWG